MEKPNPAQVTELISDVILRFYDVERDMLVPTQPEGQRRNENDAEHSWSVAVLACSLAEYVDADLDKGLVSQYGIVHDMVEVFAKDTSVWADDAVLGTKDEKEAASLQIFKSRFGHFAWLVETLESYERQDTLEAQYVRAIDKFVALAIRFMDGGEFFRSQGITKEIFERNLADNRVKAHASPGVGFYYERVRDLYDAHPEHFYSA